MSLTFVLCDAFVGTRSFVVIFGPCFEGRIRISYRVLRKINSFKCVVRSLFLVSLLLRFGSFRGIVVRLFSFRAGVCVWNVPLSLYRFVVVLPRSFGSWTLVAFVSRFPLPFSYRRFVGTLL